MAHENEVVLIKIEGGVADVLTVPPGVTVVVKDYDTQGCDREQISKDVVDTVENTVGDEFIFAVRNGSDDAPNPAAEVEARRIIELDRAGVVAPGVALRGGH